MDIYRAYVKTANCKNRYVYFSVNTYAKTNKDQIYLITL